MRALASSLQQCQSTQLMGEIATRLALGVLLAITEHTSPRVRDIHPEEWWLYKNHPIDSYFPGWLLWLSILLIIPVGLYCLSVLWPESVPIVGVSATNSSKSSVLSPWIVCQLTYWLIILLAGNLTNTVKLLVGRPRPDFFYRCYPDDHEASNLQQQQQQQQQSSFLMAPCYGDADSIIEGRKSFPSGHSAFSFASLGFVSLLLWRRLGVWRYPGSAWQLLLGGLPLYAAMCVALSRMVDYHHHCEDVAVGSALGFAVAYICFRLYYPNSNGFLMDCSQTGVPGQMMQRSASAMIILGQQQQSSLAASKVATSASDSTSFNMQASSSQSGLFEVRSM